MAWTRPRDYGIEAEKVFVETIVVEDEAVIIDLDTLNRH